MTSLVRIGLHGDSDLLGIGQNVLFSKHVPEKERNDENENLVGYKTQRKLQVLSA